MLREKDCDSRSREKDHDIHDGAKDDGVNTTVPRFRLLASDGPLLCTHFAIIIICGLTLILGRNGTVRVSEDWTIFRPSIVAFAVGIVVQIALIAPLELSRRIAQLWYWRELTTTGMSFRSMMCTWSVIYSNSYRGAEDLLKGIGPISAFLMLMYLVEVAICGAIGSLYQTTDVTTLKASGVLPMYFPMQDPAKSMASAIQPIELASRAFLNFVKAYDPLTLEGLVYGNGTCHAANDLPNTAGSERFCSAVALSPLTGLRLTLPGEPSPALVPWTQLALGDIVETKSTILEANVACAPSSDIYSGSLDDTTDVYLFVNLNINGTPQVKQSYFQLFTVEESDVTTPQVQTVMFSNGDNFDPAVDDSGALVFGVVALNFDDYGPMTPLTIPLKDHPGTRNIGALLCTAQLALGTADTVFEVTQTEPATTLKLRSASDESKTPYSMNADTKYGYASALFLFQTLYVITCDILPCVFAGTSPPVFDLLIGMLASSVDANGTRTYSIDLPTIASSLSQLIARMMTGFASAPGIPEDLTPPGTAATTNARVYQTGHIKQMFTSAVCDLVLFIGATSAACVMLVLTLGGRQWRLAGSTESVYLLLQSLPAQKLPNISARDWPYAHLGKLKDAARAVHVKGISDGGRVRLELSNASDKRAASKSEPLAAAKTETHVIRSNEV
ncbi:hypothetical protein HDU86_003304 [Geranomyces michiganensis]|nr:hypothetical protein HDU86_003304 [Geranomyces michiganensis]